MRILFICDQSPFEHYYGSQQRSNLILDALCSKGQVDLVCFTSESLPQSKSNPNCTIKYFGKLPEKKHNLTIQKFLKLFNIIHSFSPYSVYSKNKVAFKITHTLLRSFYYDYIVIRYIKNAFLCGLFKDNRIIADVDDLPEQSILSYLAINKYPWYKYIQYRFYALRAKYHTDRFIRGIKHSFFSNQFDCKWENSSFLPNIPFPSPNVYNDLDEQTYQIDDEIVLFIGFMHHTPNSQGLDYFIKNIWQNVINIVPNAKLKIVGEGVTISQKEVWEKYEGIKILGFVQDIASEYKKCKVVVVPVYFGAGSNIKILEAMSMKRACVISEFSAMPYKNDLIDSKNIMIAKNDQDFVEKLIRLLLDNSFNKSIAINGAKIIEERYSYSVFAQCINKYVL